LRKCAEGLYLELINRQAGRAPKRDFTSLVRRRGFCTVGNHTPAHIALAEVGRFKPVF
jgi:hypothetical protein